MCLAHTHLLTHCRVTDDLQELLGRAAVRIVEDDDDPSVSLKPRASRHRGAATTPLYRRGQQCAHWSQPQP